MILVGNKADLEVQRQVSLADRSNVNPLTKETASTSLEESRVRLFASKDVRIKNKESG